MQTQPQNPYRPGAGHVPPFLAGRKPEQDEFTQILNQEPLLQNLIITGLRGVGKTVLMESLKPLAQQSGWAWIGSDLSESASLSELQLVERLLTDLSVYSGTFTFGVRQQPRIGFGSKIEQSIRRLDHEGLRMIFQATPGLTSDKLRSALEFTWAAVSRQGTTKGILFAYDEAQTLSDHPKKEQYPLAMILDVFQSIQRKGVRMMLVLTGLPTLFPQLVQSRTYAERMFKVLELRRLPELDARNAIVVPLERNAPQYRFADSLVADIIRTSAGYPYFIQFICREIFDLILRLKMENRSLIIPMRDIVQKLDTDFFSGRWARVTDRQRDLLRIIARLPNRNDEFTAQDIVAQAQAIKDSVKPFSASHVIHMLNALADRGIVYKNRHGKYVFAVPLFGDFIQRVETPPSHPR